MTTTNGYNFTVATVARGLRFPTDLTDEKFPALFIAATDEQRDNITRNQFKGVIRATLVGYVKGPNGVDGVQAQLDKFIEDITKALEQDRTFGGRVHWTEVARIRTDDGDLEDHGATLVEVNFNYAATGTQP